jgi:hypothetical protein
MWQQQFICAKLKKYMEIEKNICTEIFFSIPLRPISEVP